MSSFSDAPMFFKEDAEVILHQNIIGRYTALSSLSMNISKSWYIDQPHLRSEVHWMKRPVGNTCFDSGFFQLQGRCRVLAAMSFSTDIFPYIYNLL